jgi:hypothetical protein
MQGVRGMGLCSAVPNHRPTGTRPVVAYGRFESACSGQSSLHRHEAGGGVGPCPAANARKRGGGKRPQVTDA